MITYIVIKYSVTNNTLLALAATLVIYLTNDSLSIINTRSVILFTVFGMIGLLF